MVLVNIGHGVMVTVEVVGISAVGIDLDIDGRHIPQTACESGIQHHSAVHIVVSDTGVNELLYVQGNLHSQVLKFDCKGTAFFRHLQAGRLFFVQNLHKCVSISNEDILPRQNMFLYRFLSLPNYCFFGLRYKYLSI